MFPPSSGHFTLNMKIPLEQCHFYLPKLYILEDHNLNTSTIQWKPMCIIQPVAELMAMNTLAHYVVRQYTSQHCIAGVVSLCVIHKIHDIHINVILRWTSPIPWISTKMNCYSSHNYKQHSSNSNNCSSNITNYSILL
jgi:hypothetical protein